MTIKMMQRVLYLLLGLIFLLFFDGLAQVPPQGISYQAVARNDNGTPMASQVVSIRFSILANAPDGIAMWIESHELITDQYGLFSTVIGQGTPEGGNSPTFDLIQWQNATYYLQVELDPGDGIYELMGTSEFLTVPYAFYAAKSGGDDDADPQNELIESLSVVNDSLVITESGIDHVIDLGAIAGGSSTDECISLIQLTENQLNVVECGEAHVIDLTPLIDDGDWQQNDGVVYNEDDFVGIGTDAPTSHLDVSGSVSYQISVFSGPGNILMDENVHVIVADLTNDDLTFTLPAAASCNGRVYTVKMISSGPPNDLNLVTNETETIDLVDDPVISGVDDASMTIISDGSNWWVISGSLTP